ncbi:MAG: metal ABC transporter permease [Planctomycetota bacterium]|nr:metal ABC transporter permease [Planctomycetota bacterium]MDA1178069.1 metal ABC transporter permease [Planctomycetota bacterium]
MFGSFAWDWALDGWIVTTGILCAISATLLGNFLVLRRMSMLGDAISHAVLPGLAAAFLISNSRSSLPMFIGAVIVGILTALFTEWIRGIGKVDEGASMGVVFTSLFALGLVMVVQAADHVDLDPGCVLYGAIELTPLDTIPVAGLSIPRSAITLSIVTLINALFVSIFYKELKISSFDPALSTTTGFHAGLIHYALMTLVAVTAVASFESVGNILVVAMFIVPPCAAYLLADRIGTMITISVGIAVASAVLGHISAVVVPTWFGYHSTSTAGMMAVAAGLIFVLSAILGPRHGIFVKLARRHALSWRILTEDVISLLYRLRERNDATIPNRANLQAMLLTGNVATRVVLGWLTHRGDIRSTVGCYQLTDQGETRARSLVRSHRLWEQYLVSLAGGTVDRIHDKAEQLEHFTDRQLRERLDAETETPQIDPHGSHIPPEK